MQFIEDRWQHDSFINCHTSFQWPPIMRYASKVVIYPHWFAVNMSISNFVRICQVISIPITNNCTLIIETHSSIAWQHECSVYDYLSYLKCPLSIIIPVDESFVSSIAGFTSIIRCNIMDVQHRNDMKEEEIYGCQRKMSFLDFHYFNAQQNSYMIDCQQSIGSVVAVIPF